MALLVYSGATLLTTIVLTFHLLPKLSEFFHHVDNPRKVKEFPSRVAELLFSTTLVPLATYVMTTEDAIWMDPVLGTTFLQTPTCGLLIGFLLADLYFDVHHGFYENDSDAVHHVAGIVITLTSATSRTYSYFIFSISMVEISTIFWDIRWLFRFFGYTKSSHQVGLSSVCFTVTFFLTRILTIPFLWHVFFCSYRQGSLQPNIGITIITSASMLTLNIVNVHWFRGVYIGFKKIIALKKCKESS